MKISLLQNIASSLERTGTVDSIKDNYGVFNDEPKIFFFTLSFKARSPYFSRKKKVLIQNPTTSGLSFVSKNIALLKCLMEAIERLCILKLKSKPRLSLSYSDIKKQKNDVIDLIKYYPNRNINNEKFCWSKGFDVTKNKQCYVPTQLGYFDFQVDHYETMLTTRISTGAAAGFDHVSTLLRGIYELIERDAFMCVYLCKINVKKLKLDTIENSDIRNILRHLKRYNLEIEIFDITTDFRLPTYLTLIIDRTGLGPPISVGAKTNLNSDLAIIGSIEESMLTRPWLRRVLDQDENMDLVVEPQKISSLLDRAKFWLDKDIIKKGLDFLFKADYVVYQPRIEQFTKEKELNYVLKLIHRSGHSVYYLDVTQSKFKKIGIRVYKVIIPMLQPLYLNEHLKEINLTRLKKISLFFNQKNLHINKIPHPFL